MPEPNLASARHSTSFENRRYQVKNFLTNVPKWCFFPPLKMKTTFVSTLKHTPADGCMSIWQRNCFDFGIVGRNR